MEAADAYRMSKLDDEAQFEKIGGLEIKAVPVLHNLSGEYAKPNIVEHTLMQ